MKFFIGYVGLRTHVRILSCLVKIFTGHKSIDMIGEVINKYYTHTHTHTYIYIYVCMYIYKKKSANN